MKRIRICIWLALTTVASAEEPQRLPELLEETRARHEVCSLGGLVIVDGKVHEIAVCGTVSRDSDEAVPLDARWHLGSCTKSMTATLAAVMVQEGDFSWDLTLAEAFEGSDFEIHPDYRSVTPVELFAHRAGVPNNLLTRPLFWLLASDSQRDPVDQRRRLLRDYLPAAPMSKPNSEFAYSNEGYVIAGHLLERKAGKAFEDVLIDKVFKPLGCRSAGFGPPPGKNDPRGHRFGVPQEPGPAADNPPALGPAGRVHMTLSDWGKYALEHLRAARGEPTTLLQPSSAKRLHTAPAGSYALGWGTPNMDWADGLVLAHAGSNTMWFAEIWIVPDRNFAALVTANEGTENAEAAVRSVAVALANQHIPSSDVVAARAKGHVPMNTLEDGFMLHVEDRSGKGSESSPLYVACNHNDWDPCNPKWRMARKDGLWVLQIPKTHKSERMQFKITRGSWATVEVDEAMRDVPNRRVQFSVSNDSGARMQVTIPAFADQSGE